MNAQPKQLNPILKLHQRQSEAKKVSVDEGYTQIPNELLETILAADLTASEIKLILFVYRKTVGWHKEVDWICDEQIAEGCHFRDFKEANRVKINLIKREILIKQGRKIGLNLFVSEWKNKIQNNSEIRKISENNPKNFEMKSDKLPNTKETITKEKINNTPIPPKGESAHADTQAVGKIKKSAKPKIDYQAIVDLYNQANEDSGGRLPFVESLSDKRKRTINKFWSCLKNQSLDGVGNYFEAFFENLTPHHLGKNDRGWRASFDFAIREDIVIRVREGAL